ncbi:unnamed protein product, partial [Prorocentrum cordatum]
PLRAGGGAGPRGRRARPAPLLVCAAGCTRRPPSCPWAWASTCCSTAWRPSTTGRGGGPQGGERAPGGRLRARRQGLVQGALHVGGRPVASQLGRPPEPGRGRRPEIAGGPAARGDPAAAQRPGRGPRGAARRRRSRRGGARAAAAGAAGGEPPPLLPSQPVGALGTRPQADGDRSPREASVPQQAVAVLSVPDVPLGQSLRASGISCMGAAGLMVDANIRKLHGEEKIKHLGRFVELLQMDPAEENHTFQIEQLQTVLVERRYGITVERLQSVVAEMMRVGAGRDRARSILARGKSRSRSGLFWQATRDSVLKPDSSSPERGEPSACTKGVDLLTFVEVVVDPDLPTRVGASFRHDVTRIRQLLLQSDIDEIIRKVTRVRKNRASDYASEPEDGGMDTDLILFRLNVLVSVTVLLSVLFLGVSMDYEPSSG